MVQKIPPPPPLAVKDPLFNRWLLELTAILNASGGIDPTSITGLEAAYANIATLQIEVATLQTQVGGNTGNISTLQGQIATINGEITAINGTLTLLLARNQVINGTVAPGAGLGVDGDWYADTSAKHIYVKVAGAWVQII